MRNKITWCKPLWCLSSSQLPPPLYFDFCENKGRWCFFFLILMLWVRLGKIYRFISLWLSCAQSWIFKSLIAATTNYLLKVIWYTHLIELKRKPLLVRRILNCWEKGMWYFWNQSFSTIREWKSNWEWSIYLHGLMEFRLSRT